MRVISRYILASTTLVLFGGNAHAQDLFGSTNTTSHSYNYIEAQYLVDVDATPPVLASILLDASDHWSIKGEYIKQDFGNQADLAGLDPSVIEINAEITAVSVGGLYHRPFSMLKRSDWIAGFMVGRAEILIESEQLGFRESSNFSFQELYAGIRKTFTPKLEGEVAINYYRDSDTSDFSGDVKVVYRVIRSFDVALAVNEINSDGDNFVGIGLRYTW